VLTNRRPGAPTEAAKPVTIPAGLAAELTLLTQALDLPGTDVAETLTRLAADAQTAIDSYLGLSIAITANRAQFDLTVLTEGTQPEHIRSSLLVPLATPAGISPAASTARTAAASLTLILYAATPGAFTDLAADLSWITGRALADFRLDEHRTLPEHYTHCTHLKAESDINQALGVLIGRGLTPDQAERDLYARAAIAGIEVLAVATLILAALIPPVAETEHP
jgi:hypothetical protein